MLAFSSQYFAQPSFIHMAYVCVQINLASNYIGGYYDTNQRKVLHTPEGPKAISDALRVSPSVTSVSLLGNRFDDATVEMLLNLKKAKSSLTSLCGLKLDQTEADFSRWGLIAQDAKLLAPEIAVRASITSIDLSENDFGPEGAKALAPAIAVNPSVTSINLASNNIGGYYPPEAQSSDDFIATPEGPQAIADAIRVSTSVTSVNLLRNEFDTEAASMLLKMKEQKPIASLFAATSKSSSLPKSEPRRRSTRSR